MRAPTALGCIALFSLWASPARAQVARSVSGLPAEVAEAVRAVDEHHTALRPLDAVAAVDEALALHPESYPLLWRAARESLSLGLLASSADDRTLWEERAIEYARRAVEARPGGVEGQSLLARSLWADARNRTVGVRARRSAEVLAAARRTLELDPSDGHAHRVLGEWHTDIMSLSTVARWTVQRVVAGVIEEASWTEAEDHLRLATSSQPQVLAHHLALGRMLLERGRTEEARAALRQVVDRPSVEPEDPLLKQQARTLLAEMG